MIELEKISVFDSSTQATTATATIKMGGRSVTKVAMENDCLLAIFKAIKRAVDRLAGKKSYEISFCQVSRTPGGKYRVTVEIKNCGSTINCSFEHSSIYMAGAIASIEAIKKIYK